MMRCSFFVFGVCVLLANNALADGGAGRADSHAPIGVMGDHIHKKGEFMVSFRHMSMSMKGNRQGRNDVSDDSIATSISNPFASMPPTLRIVPQEMTTRMNMLGLMYAPSDTLTLMAMVNHISKDMRLKTFQGGMGTQVRGFFDSDSSGWGDTKVGALISAINTPEHKLHFNVVMSLPTGDIDNRGSVLPPVGTINSATGEPNLVSVRLPYAMQLGSGTYDFEPGLTYKGTNGKIGWGAQYSATIRLGENDEGYALGDQHKLSAWGHYLFQPAVSVSIRLTGKHLGTIDGIDSQIMGPVQTADPSNYGGEYVDVALGINLLGQKGWSANHRLAIEYGKTLMQDVNGVQLKMDDMLTLGYQYPF